MNDQLSKLLEESERSRRVLLSLLEDQKTAEETLKQRHLKTIQFQEIVGDLAVSEALIEGDIQKFAAALNERVANALSIERVSVWLFNEDHTQLVCVDLYELSPNAHSGGAVLHENEFRNEFTVLKTEKYVDANDPMTDPRTSGYVEGYLIPNNITSMLDAVIRFGEKLLGTLCFEHVNQKHHWDAEEISFASQLGDQIAITIYNKERISNLSALQENEAKFRTLADFTYDWELWEGADGKILYTSPSCFRITGYTQEEFLNDPQLLKKIVHPADAEAFANHHKATTNGSEKIEDIEFRIIKKSGEEIVLAHLCRPIFDDHNVYRGRRISNRDTTLKWQAGEKLKKQYEILSQLFFLANIVSKAESLDKVYAKALESILFSLSAQRASLLLFDESKTLRFVAWKGLSDEYRAVCEGHSPWKYGDSSAEPIFVEDVEQYDELQALMPIILKEKIHSLAFIPLIAQGTLLGKFMIYYDSVHKFTENEKQLLKTFSTNIAFAISQKRVEDALFQSEENYRKLVDTASDIIYTTNKDGYLVYANPVGLKMFCDPKKELSRIHHLDFIVPEQRERVFKLLSDKFVSENSSIRFEVKAFTRDGRRVWLEQNVKLLKNENKIDGFHVIARDISERKETEEALEESETTFRRLFEESADPILLLDDSGFFACNQATVTLLGYSSKEEFLHAQPWELSPERQPDGMLSSEKAELMILKAIRDGHNRFEWIHKKVDGTEFPVEVMLTSITIKRKQSFYTVWRDITEQKLAATTLVESEAKYRELVENSPDAIAIYVQGKIAFLNNECVRLMAASSQEELLGKSVLDFVHPASRELVVQRMKDVIGGKIALPPAEEKFIRLDGKEVDVEVKAMSIKYEHQPAVQLIIRDITDRKRMTEELISAKNNAERANSVKDGFIANMSHEIRTPLNGILGITSIIKESFSKYITEEEEYLFDGIDRSSQRIIRTIDMILNFSRLQSGDFPVERKRIELASICESLVKDFQPMLKDAGLSLAFENKCPNTLLFADEYTVTNSLSNLIDNAIKYTKKGHITLTLQPENENEILLKVTDTGIGISEDFIPSLFEPYRQEEMGYGRAFEGVGLGLSLVKKFLDLNGAQIEVESKKGEGSTFTIRFKALLSQTAKPVQQKPPAAIHVQTHKIHDGVKRKILVVEDDPINQITIKQFLKKDYITIIANSAEEVMSVLTSENNFDSILMDISIGGAKDGLELTKELKAMPAYSALPIIAITAHAFDKDKQNALNAGCDEYLPKPFTKEALLSLLDQIIK